MGLTLTRILHQLFQQLHQIQWNIVLLKELKAGSWDLINLKLILGI